MFADTGRFAELQAGPAHVGIGFFQRLRPLLAVRAALASQDASEVSPGSRVDPQFRPALVCGTGGQLVAGLQDRALGLRPLNPTLARGKMEQTKIYTALKGVRGRRPVDMAALE